MLSGVFACDDHYEFCDLPADHPFVYLSHDLLDICLDLVVTRNEHCEAIFLDGVEVFGRVDASLE